MRCLPLGGVMKIGAVLLTAALALTGCGNAQNTTTNSSSTTTAATISTGTVNLGQYELAPSEIPAQRQARVEEGQAAKLPDGTDAFYADGDEVVVLCRTW